MIMIIIMIMIIVNTTNTTATTNNNNNDNNEIQLPCEALSAMLRSKAGTRSRGSQKGAVFCADRLPSKSAGRTASNRKRIIAKPNRTETKTFRKCKVTEPKRIEPNRFLPNDNGSDSAEAIGLPRQQPATAPRVIYIYIYI